MHPQIPHISFIAKGGFTQYPSVDILLNAMSTDWIQYAPGHWLINTARTATEISDTMTRLIGTVHIGTLVIVGVNASERQGLASPEVWTWLKKYDKTVPAMTNQLIR